MKAVVHRRERSRLFSGGLLRSTALGLTTPGETWGMFQFLGRFAATRPWWICGAWLLLGVGVAVVAPDAGRGTQDDDIRFLPALPQRPRLQAPRRNPSPRMSSPAASSSPSNAADAPLTDADLRLVDAHGGRPGKLKENEPGLQIGRVVSHRQPFLGKRLLSEDGRCTLLQVSLATPYMALQTATAVDRAEQVVRQRLDEAGAAAPQLYVTGHAGIGRDLVRASATASKAPRWPRSSSSSSSCCASIAPRCWPWSRSSPSPARSGWR